MKTKQYFVKMEGSFILVTASEEISIENVERSMINKYDGRLTEIWDIKDNPEDFRLNHINKEIQMFKDSFGMFNLFEVVDEFPGGYVVWNIGRHNFPCEEYVPIAKDMGNYQVSNPKCIKVKDEETALAIMHASEHGKGNIGRFEFQRLCGH